MTVALGDERSTISYAQIGRDYDMREMVGRALSVGRDGSFIDEMRTLANGGDVGIAVTWDNEALIRELDGVFARAEVTPTDATIVREGSDYSVTPATDGRTFDREAAYRAAMAAIANPAVNSSAISAQVVPVAAGVSTAEAQAAVDRLDRAVGSAITLTVSEETLSIPASVLRGWTRLQPSAEAGSWDVVVDPAPIAQYVDEFATTVNVDAVNASFEFAGREAVVVDAQDGAAIDTSAAVSAIVAALAERADGASPSTLSLSLQPVSPEFSSGEAQALVSRIDRLGRWTTHFKVSPLNGNGINIRRPAKLINGMVVQPGAMFDFIDAAGPFTRRNGYEDGAAIQNGQTKPEGILGGGLCSASTTLFNAALRAGFQIDERHNHSFYISRYPVGLDATIWENGRIRKSMQFTNDTDYPILIRASYSPGRVTFEIWGVPDGRTVKFSKPDVQHEKKAENFVEYSDELPPGVIERKEYRADGFDSTVTRTVYSASGAVIHEDTFFSDYIKVNGIYKVGRYPGDPRDGVRVPAAEWEPSGPPQPEPTEPTPED